jgi:hypothetical protein
VLHKEKPPLDHGDLLAVFALAGHLGEHAAALRTASLARRQLVLVDHDGR